MLRPQRRMFLLLVKCYQNNQMNQLQKYLILKSQYKNMKWMMNQYLNMYLNTKERKNNNWKLEVKRVMKYLMT